MIRQRSRSWRRCDVSRERAIDRRRIAALEREEPQPMQKDRGEILRALLAANGGKMLAKEARKRMHLSKARFSILLSTLTNDIDSRSYHLDRGRSFEPKIVSRD